MADIAQGYLHLEPIALHRSPTEIGGALISDATEIAREIYDFDTLINVRIEEGSFKTWITVTSLLFNVYSGISDYDDFKRNAISLYEDAIDFGEKANTAIQHAFGARDGAIIHKERRTKSSGKIYRIIKRIDRLKENKDRLSPRDVEQELQKIQIYLRSLAKDMDDDEINFIKNELKIPQPKAPAPETPKYILKPEQLEIETRVHVIPEGDGRKKLLYKGSKLVRASSRRSSKGRKEPPKLLR